MRPQNHRSAKRNPAARNARFWLFENDGWIKLTLRPGQQLAWRKFTRDCEGWILRFRGWTHAGDQVEEYNGAEGKDCDGRILEASTWTAPIAFMGRHAVNDQIRDGIDRPVDRNQWTEIEWTGRDFTAEAAGY